MLPHKALLALIFLLGIRPMGTAFGAVAVPRVQLVGEWEDKTEPIEQFRLSLRADGTYSLTVMDLAGTKSDRGQWKIEGDVLVLQMTETEHPEECDKAEWRLQVDALSRKSLNLRAREGRKNYFFSRAAH